MFNSCCHQRQGGKPAGAGSSGEALLNGERAGKVFEWSQSPQSAVPHLPNPAQSPERIPGDQHTPASTQPCPAPVGRAPRSDAGSCAGGRRLPSLPNNCGCPTDGYSKATAGRLCPALKASDGILQPHQTPSAAPLAADASGHLTISPIAPLRQYPQYATVHIKPTVIFINTLKEQSILRCFTCPDLSYWP